MIRALYDYTLSLAEHPRARWALGAVSFAESSVFPIPPDVLLIPMVLAERAKARSLAILCTVTSVLGGIAGYAIGFFLYEAVGQPILELYNYADKFQSFAGQYNDYGAWIVFLAGVTPFPYKVITIASGVSALDLGVFIVASVLSRGLRFFVVAGLLYLYGPPIRTFIEKRLGLMFAIFMVLLIGGFVAIKFVL